MNPAPEFEVGISGAMRERLVRLHRHAVVDDRGAEFLAALDAVVNRLRSDPMTFGEELFDLKALKTAVKVVVRYPLVVEFAVFVEQRRVFVRTARYLGPD